MIEFDLGDGMIGDCYVPFHFMPDFSACTLSKESIQAGMSDDMTADRRKVISDNCAAHARHVSHDSAIRNLRSDDNDTVILVASGPSATGIARRVEPYRELGLKICTLNLGTTLIHDPDYVACYERLAKPEWWKSINPEKTKLLTAPLCPKEALDTWVDGKNIYYSWIADIRGADDPRWASLDPVVGGYTTAVSALHALFQLGFKNILIVGCDFSSSAPKVGDASNGIAKVSATFYADGTQASDSYVRGYAQQFAIGVGGKRCVTNEMQLRHSLAMKSVCNMASRAGCNVINAANQGILDIEKCVPLELALDAIYEPKLREVA